MGFSSTRVLTLDSVSKDRQPSEVWQQVADHLNSVAGVESASVAGWALMRGTSWNGSVWANGHSPENEPITWFLAVSPGWLETMSIPLTQGRDIRRGESFPDAGIVNDTFARRYFAGQSAIGRTFEVQSKGGRSKVEIIGQVRDARYTDLRGSMPATVYYPFQGKEGTPGNGYDRATFIVRTKDADPMSMAAALRAEIPRGHPAIRVANIVTQEEFVRSQTIRERMLALLSMFFAVVALVLAGVGLYGVLDYAVLERRRELGIRIALGARAADIVRRVTIEVFGMLALGAGTGLVLGMASEQYIGNLLYQVKTTDPSILVLPVVTILGAALLAAMPPVLRAVRIDPTTLLRAE
jgi:putative ABC transport system permease protein